MKAILITLSALAMAGCISRDVASISYTKEVKTARKKKPIVVAVIDTGIRADYKNAKFLCNEGHMDFTGTGIEDTHGHGTNISGLIDQYAKNMLIENGYKESDIIAKDADYCQVILKYYDVRQSGSDNMRFEIAALKRAIDLKVDIINFSGGGEEFDVNEAQLVRKAIKMGIKVVVAAGNESHDINIKPYYPAAVDPRATIVGNLSHGHSRASSSNYGNKVNTWELGTSRLGYGNIRMTGTSQATAVKSGKIVHDLLTTK